MTSNDSAAARHARALVPDFEIEREIGRGGMGVVYLALDVQLDRHVAIKVLPDHLAESAVVRERFLQEARTSAKLSHPNIVPIYRASEKDGVVFFVMRYVDGESLADRLAARGTLPATEVARLLHEVALALDYAHARGVVHRDVKPENTMIERGTESTLVTDFGIARLIEAAPATMTGQVLGTVHYMSPEQVLGETLDGRSDLYSLGVVGFRALTGVLPIDAETASAVLVAQVTRAAPAVRDVAPSVPAELASIIDRCLLKDRSARFATGAELAKALDDAAAAIARAAPMDPDAYRRVLSAREAEAVLGRAATLEAETGMQPALRTPRPPLAPAAFDDPRSLTSGYRFDDVRSAAAEAGIPERYVERAANELGLASDRPGDGPPIIVSSDAPETNPWIGSPMTISYEVMVPAETRAEEYEVLVDMIRRKMREPGNVSTFGRTLLWSTGEQQRRAQITIVQRGGHTIIRADERLGPLAGGLFGGIVGGVGGGAGGSMALPLGAALLHSVAIGLGLWGATIGASVMLARGIFRSARGKRERALQSLVDSLAQEVRNSTKSLPSGAPRAPHHEA